MHTLEPKASKVLETYRSIVSPTPDSELKQDLR